MVSLKPERLKRYKDVTLLLVKYGRSDLVKQAGLEDHLELDEYELSETTPKAEELASRSGEAWANLHKVGSVALHPSRSFAGSLSRSAGPFAGQNRTIPV